MNDAEMRRLYRLSDVPRWAVVPTVRKQSVAEHSFNVAGLCLWLMKYLPKTYNNIGFRLALLERAMKHDIKEAETGDTPSPAKGKREYNLPAAEDAVIKFADLLEALIFCREEEQMGNRSRMQPIISDITLQLREVHKWVPTPHDLSEIIDDAQAHLFNDGLMHPAMEKK